MLLSQNAPQGVGYNPTSGPTAATMAQGPPHPGSIAPPLIHDGQEQAAAATMQNYPASPQQHHLASVVWSNINCTVLQTGAAQLVSQPHPAR
jgi:hypothetical protein